MKIGGSGENAQTMYSCSFLKIFLRDLLVFVLVSTNKKPTDQEQYYLKCRFLPKQDFIPKQQFLRELERSANRIKLSYSILDNFNLNIFPQKIYFILEMTLAIFDPKKVIKFFAFFFLCDGECKCFQKKLSKFCFVFEINWKKILIALSTLSPISTLLI